MRRMRVLRLRVRSLFSRTIVEEELDEELRYHLERQTEANLALGMSYGEARRAALLDLEGIDWNKEECRDMRGLNVLENLKQDLRFTVRQFEKSPGFAATAVLILALGMSAAVSIFGLVDAALIRPLPYQAPSRLVSIFGSIPLGPRFHLSSPDYADLKKLNHVFASFEVYGPYGFMINTPAGGQNADGARVSDGFFRELGVNPILGRDFRPGEDQMSAARTVLLSYSAWQKRYGGRSDVLGQVVMLDGSPNIIIGVLPRDFHFAPAEPADFWATLHDDNNCRGCHWLFGVARLKDGVSLETAAAEMKSISRQLELQYPNSNRDQGTTVLPLTEVIFGDIRPILLMLFTGAGLLLLITSINVSSLLLVRAESRRREIAVRGALGASPARLRRQFVTEGLTLVTIGGWVGLTAAGWLMQLLIRLIPKDMLAGMPYLQMVGLNFRVVAFACAIAILAAVLFSVVPAWRLSRPALRAGLDGRGFAGTMWRRFGANFVVVELAIAMVLLISAGLLGKSFYRLLQVDPGLMPDHLATIQVGLPSKAYSKDAQVLARERQLVERIGALPGVRAVGVTNQLPLGDGDGTTQFVIAGRPNLGPPMEVAHRQISRSYFPALGARLLRGRLFTEADVETQPRVVIINQALARLYFPGEDPTLQRIAYRDEPERIMQIAGVVDDVREGPLDVPARATMYVPFNQRPSRYFAMVVRTSQAEGPLLPSMEAAVRGLDPAIMVSSPGTMMERIRNSPSAYLRRSSAWVAAGFAAIALLLGVVGLYGVIAYSVSQRTREIGIRMALGAQQGWVCQLILKEAGGLIALGIAIGIVCSLAAATLMRNLLFGVHTWDPPTVIAVGATLAMAALVASYIPARRAASVHVIDALRAE